MNWDAVGAIGEVVGAFAVVCSLIYLGYQLRQNTRTAEVTAYQEMVRRIAELRQVMLGSPELAQALNKAMREEEMSNDEKRRYEVYLHCMLMNADAAFFQHQKGILPWERLIALTQPLVRHFGYTRRAHLVWSNRQDEYIPDFRQFLEKQLSKK